MKKLIFFAFASAALVAGLVGCNKDNAAAKGGDDAEQSYISIAIRSNDPGTRNLTDNNSTNAEALVKTVDVFIYNGSGVFMKHEHLTSADFTPDTGTADDKYVATTKIATTTGVKKVHVGINLPSGSFSDIIAPNSSDAKLSDAAMAITRAYVNNPTLNGTPMFSETAAIRDVIPDPTGTSNKFDVTVQRLVAKVVVAQSSSMAKTGVDGELGAMEFSLNNVHEKTFALQGAAPLYKGPNWSAWVLTDFSKAVAADYKAVDVTPPANIVAYTNPCYALENTFQNKTSQEATRLTVRAQFAPKNYFKVNGVAPGYIATDVTADPQTLGTTFYSITIGIGNPTAFFYDNAAALAYQTDKGGDIFTYSNGWCYWHSFKFNPTDADKKFQMLRNDIYEFTINSVMAPGNWEPDIDPIKPLDDESYMLVNINIKPWNNPITTGIDLQ